MSQFEDLEVWQTARTLTAAIYRISNHGPLSRDFGLQDQMRRSAVSIMSNIAEGFESHTTALYINYLARAKASAGELRAQLYVALDAGYINTQQFNTLHHQAQSISRQLSAFMKYLKRKEEDRRKKEE